MSYTAQQHPHHMLWGLTEKKKTQNNLSLSNDLNHCKGLSQFKVCQTKKHRRGRDQGVKDQELSSLGLNPSSAIYYLCDLWKAAKLCAPQGPQL